MVGLFGTHRVFLLLPSQVRREEWKGQREKPVQGKVLCPSDFSVLNYYLLQFFFYLSVIR